jgi:hypothetical protein
LTYKSFLILCITCRVSARPSGLDLLCRPKPGRWGQKKNICYVSSNIQSDRQHRSVSENHQYPCTAVTRPPTHQRMPAEVAAEKASGAPPVKASLSSVSQQSFQSRLAGVHENVSGVSQYASKRNRADCCWR